MKCDDVDKIMGFYTHSSYYTTTLFTLLVGERYFMSRDQPILSSEHCAMSKKKDECQENNG